MGDQKNRGHLYLKMDEYYDRNRMVFEIQKIDTGIAMAPPEVSFLSRGNRGKWTVEDTLLGLPDDNYE